MRVFECYSFNSILEYRKIGKSLPKCIFFLQNMILNGAKLSISYDNRQILLCLRRISMSLSLVSTNLKCVMDAFKKKRIYCIALKNGEVTQDPEIWVENMLSPNI